METSANGPTRGLSRPPLPHPRRTKRSLKQREREVPDVDWERSLQHFAAAVSDDLDELTTRFLQENAVTFAAWKRLWSDARMSAAFHVEFWESSPTKTHKTILQQTLDALVCTIQEHDGEFESETHVAALIARVFALYCAYSVQLGTPRHKIDVDPQDWTSLLTINCVMCGVGATVFPTAAREVRAMMHRLAVEEKAFLRCLQGFGPSVRVRKRPVTLTGEDGAGQDLSLIVDTSTEGDALITQSTVEQLKSLNDRYQELMSRARSFGPSVTGVGACVGARRGKHTVSTSLLSGSLLQEAGNDKQDLDRALTSYVEYKSNKDLRRNDRVVRAAAARKYERRSVLEQTGSERNDHSNILDLDNHKTMMSAPPSTATISIISIQQLSVASEISEADSDALADLERELEQSVDVVSAPKRKEAASAKVSTPVPRKRGRPAGIVSRKVHQDEPRAILSSRPSVASEISEADSDALADLERELEQSVDVVSAPKRKEAASAKVSTRIVLRRKTSTARIKTLVTQKKSLGSPKAVASWSLVAHSKIPSRPVSAPTGLRRSARLSSLASETESDGLEELMTELENIPVSK